MWLVIIWHFGCIFQQELVQRGLEKSSKRGSGEKTNGDASKNHLMINKTKVEKQINKEPEYTSWGWTEKMEKQKNEVHLIQRTAAAPNHQTITELPFQNIFMLVTVGLLVYYN